MWARIGPDLENKMSLTKPPEARLSKQLWLHLPEALLDKVDAAAALEHRTRGSYIRAAWLEALGRGLKLPAGQPRYVTSQDVKVCCVRFPVGATQPLTEDSTAKRAMSAYAILAINTKLNAL